MKRMYAQDAAETKKYQKETKRLEAENENMRRLLAKCFDQKEIETILSVPVEEMEAKGVGHVVYERFHRQVVLKA